MKTRRARRVRLILLLFGVVLLVGGAAAALRLGTWLTSADPLVRSDVIFVTDGKFPQRELEAAALLREGWAPRIALTLSRDDLSEEARGLAGQPRPQERSLQVLQRVGVPEGSIVRLDRMVENTLDELGVDFDYARAHGFRRVIIVSSPYHLRRVRTIWRSRFEHEVSAIVRATRYEPFEASRWWRSRRSIEVVVHELFGIAHFLIGSPIPSYDRGG